MASPSMTQNSYGNLANVVAIAASGVSSPVTVDATTKFEVQLQFDILTGGTAQAAGTATAAIYRLFGAGRHRTPFPSRSFRSRSEPPLRTI